MYARKGRVQANGKISRVSDPCDGEVWFENIIWTFLNMAIFEGDRDTFNRLIINREESDDNDNFYLS